MAAANGRLNPSFLWRKVVDGEEARCYFYLVPCVALMRCVVSFAAEAAANFGRPPPGSARSASLPRWSDPAGWQSRAD